MAFVDASYFDRRFRRGLRYAPMRIFVKLAFIVLAIFVPALSSSSAVLARELKATDKAAIAARLALMDEIVKTQEYGKVFDMMPPKVLAAMIIQNGGNYGQFRINFLSMMAQASKDIKILSVNTYLNNSNFSELPNGLSYVLIPTHTVASVRGKGAISMSDHTLALLENDTWYLMRISKAEQVALLRQVYPEFSSIELPLGTAKAYPQ
jgi:hypothetical protein